jgi:hypothetical protein
MSCMRVMLRKWSRSPSGAQTIVFWIICRATRRAATAVFRQATASDGQRFDHAVVAPRGDGSLACESSMSGVLGVEIVVLASPASILFVLGRDLEHGNSGLLHIPQEASAIAAGRFHANALQVAKRSHPGQHLPIALAGRGETKSSQERDPVRQDRCDMQIFVRIHAADEATL